MQRQRKMQVKQGGAWLMNAGLLGLSLLFSACSSNPPAPVIDRLPSQNSQTSQTKSTPSAKSTPLASRTTYKSGDWRPDNYVVKKGDTLFSIGLEFGYYYKDIAASNKIAAPYVIKVGQTLALASLKEADSSVSNANGATTYPLNGAPVVTSSTTAIATTAKTPAVVAQKSAIPVLSEPKALRETYSDSAFKTPLPSAKPVIVIAEKTAETAAEKVIVKPSTTAESKPIDIKPSDSIPIDTKPTAAGELNWAWPTQGKVVGSFNQAGNKGIDIAGARGQSIMAAAPGKVIYSGSDLRGYGKLVIIKHSASFLSVYAHNNVILAKEGQQVSRGQKIAEMGSTDSNTVKLHFEIRQQGKSVDPAQFLSH